MPFETLPFVPEQRGYNAAYGNGFVSVKLGGGAARQRRDVVGAVHPVKARWFLSGLQYQQFVQFIRDEAVFGSVPFNVRLTIDFQFPALYTCTLVPDSQQIEEVRGNNYVVSASLEARALDYVVGSVVADASANTLTISGASVGLNTFLTGGGAVEVIGLAENNGSNVPVNLDGIYALSGSPSATVATLLTPASQNADWTTLVGYPSSQTSSISDVAIIATPGTP